MIRRAKGNQEGGSMPKKMSPTIYLGLLVSLHKRLIISSNLKLQKGQSEEENNLKTASPYAN